MIYLKILDNYKQMHKLVKIYVTLWRDLNKFKTNSNKIFKKIIKLILK